MSSVGSSKDESSSIVFSKEWPLLLTALGVVYGDIGTSPLYAFRESFSANGIEPTTTAVFGILSLIFWALVLVISIKYMAFVIRADNNGEGGILALTALLIPRRFGGSQRLRWVTFLGIFGSALLYADGMITPAMSVLSAVEGIGILTHAWDDYILTITVIILLLLFINQKHGTERVGSVFGPITGLWFVALALGGIYSISQNPSILAATSPWYAISFMLENPFAGFLALGSTFLAVTGGEALYADMGHFGKGPIRFNWFALVFPALVLNYFGQGALLLRDPTSVTNPFYLMFPRWALFPMVVLATMATIIASQAVITGVYSLTRQAIQLGYLPRMKIIHTSSKEIGQIYVPVMNWALLVGVLVLVGSFKTSSAVAHAYGVAVSGTMVITTLLIYFVAIKKWNWHPVLALVVMGIFLAIDIVFFTSNMTKIPTGGWFPLMVASIVFFIMTTWYKGRQIMRRQMASSLLSIEDFLEKIARDEVTTVSGTAIFMTGNSSGVPPALVNNVRFNRVIHERNIFITVAMTELPRVALKDRVKVQKISNQFYQVIVQCGFMETPHIPNALTLCRDQQLKIDLDKVSYFLGAETLIATAEIAEMALWREKIFTLMSRNAQKATTFFNIPPSQVIEVGIQVKI